MKMTPEHYNHLRAEIARIWTREKHEAHTQFVRNEGKAQDIDMRVRWDWLWYANLSQWISANLYSYLDDTHIDTALKRMMKEFARDLP